MKVEQEDGSTVELAFAGDSFVITDQGERFAVPIEFLTAALVLNAAGRARPVVYDDPDGRRVLIVRCNGCGYLVIKPRAEQDRQLHFGPRVLLAIARSYHAHRRLN